MVIHLKIKVDKNKTNSKKGKIGFLIYVCDMYVSVYANLFHQFLLVAEDS